MGKFRFWAGILLISLLGLIGFYLADFLPLPSPFTRVWTQIVYILLGMLIGVGIFARISAWIVHHATRLLKYLVARLASEIINQFTHLASRGWRALPTPGEKSDLEGIGLEALGIGGKQMEVGKAIILDTSSIIDTRVLEVARTGFLSGLILVPNFVLLELQQVADSADPLKRTRGRRGFEVINDLKKVKGIKVDVWDKEIAGKSVDDKLVRLGKILRGRILTCDFNLNRVAKIQGVDVLNLNELSNALKTLPIPGEKLKIRIVQEGKDKDQGVGYLSDGAMVVVKEGASLLGSEAQVEVTKILQGAAGRMIFGKVAS